MTSVEETETPTPYGAAGGPSRLRRTLGGLAAGVAASALGVFAWVAINKAFSIEMGWVAIPIGALIGLAVAWGASSKSRIVVPLMAVVLTLGSAVLADNFLQREHLVDGVEALQGQWSDLQIEPIVIPDVPPEAADGTSGSTTVPPASCPTNADLVPPPEIVKVLPLPAYDCMTPEILAVIYDDVPDEIRPQLPATLKAEAEALLAADAAAAANDASQRDLSEAKDAFANTDYDIPKPVLVCAPPPDFTQPTAEAGLGFRNGIPVVLPLGDLFQDNLERGDGQSYPAPSPVCFAEENAKEHPLQAASWFIGAILAGGIALVRRRKVLEPSA